MKYLIAAFLFSTVTLVNVTLGKSVKVKGTVFAFNEFPMQGVKISAKKSETVIYTDVNGTFEIEIEQKDVLIFEAKGFFTNKRKIKKNQGLLKINMVLGGSKEHEKNALSKNYLSAEDLALGLTNLSYNNVDYSMYTDVYEMIRNSFPGVSIISKMGSRGFR